MRIAYRTVLLALLLLATSASAADLCFDDDGGTIYHFKKIKLPKQPIDAVPVAGVRLGRSGVGGTAFRDASGQLRLSLITDGGACFVNVTLDDALEGEAGYTCVGGFTNTTNWTPRDCASIIY